MTRFKAGKFILQQVYMFGISFKVLDEAEAYRRYQKLHDGGYTCSISKIHKNGAIRLVCGTINKMPQ